MATDEINIKGAFNWYQIRCLLDSGSQVESITEEAADTLELPYTSSNLQINGIGGGINVTKRIATTISSRCGKFSMNIDLVIVPQLIDDQPSIQLEAKDVHLPRNVELADPTFYKRRSIEIILGARVQILGPRQLKCEGGPNLQESALGWLVGGLVSLRIPRTATMAVATVHPNEKTIPDEEDADTRLDTLFKRFWTLEQVTSAEARSAPIEVNWCEEHFLQNHDNERRRQICRSPPATRGDYVPR